MIPTDKPEAATPADWTAAARDMLSAWDSYLGGQARDQRENAHRLLLAASFARAQFEDLAALDQDAATGGMLRAFLLALIDPASPDLDHLRGCNRPTPAPQLRTYVGGSASVQVCAICDIAGCHHIRAQNATLAHPSPAPEAGDLITRAVVARILSFDPGFLRINTDGSGYFCVPDAEMAFEDDRQEGPDGPEGSIHWIARIDASEIVALRDFLNDALPAPVGGDTALGLQKAMVEEERAIRLRKDGQIDALRDTLIRVRDIALQSEAAPMSMCEIVKRVDLELVEETEIPEWMRANESYADPVSSGHSGDGNKMVSGAPGQAASRVVNTAGGRCAPEAPDHISDTGNMVAPVSAGTVKPDEIVDAWLDEMEGYSTRRERLGEDLPHNVAYPWLVAACAQALSAIETPVSAWKGIDLASGPDQTVVSFINPSQAALDVLAERQRQINKEGWTPEHDDQHVDGHMALAAATYAVASTYPETALRYVTQPYHINNIRRIAELWPWESEWWKPGPSRRMLVKSGALILAEIERLDRAATEGGEA